MCQSCEAVTINGVHCHEHGCPDVWKDRIIKCKDCGQAFIPTYDGQLFCDESCAESYWL